MWAREQENNITNTDYNNQQHTPNLLMSLNWLHIYVSSAVDGAQVSWTNQCKINLGKVCESVLPH